MNAHDPTIRPTAAAERSRPPTARRRWLGAVAVGAVAATTFTTSPEPATAQVPLPPPVLTTEVCGNGQQGDGELCLRRPRKATSFSGRAGGVAAGRINLGVRPDFAVVAPTIDRLRVKLGNGAGGFGWTGTYPMGDNPTDVALGDFNGDGRTDIAATAFGDDRVRIRWGHTNWVNWSHWNTGDGPRRIAVGDVDHNGLDDFAAVNSIGKTVSVRRRIPAGGFTWQNYATGNVPGDVELADCDADGDLDLLYTSGAHFGAVRVRRNLGNGTFGAQATVNVGSGFGVRLRDLAVGDLNNDGRVDLVVSRNTHSMARVLGTGNCTFGAPVVSPTAKRPHRIELVDLDQDGHLDMAVTHLFSNRVRVYFGQGNGNLTLKKTIVVAPNVSDVDSADFNLDGSPDLVVGAAGGAWTVLSNP